MIVPARAVAERLFQTAVAGILVLPAGNFSPGADPAGQQRLARTAFALARIEMESE